MTKLVEQAIAALETLPPAEQDDWARLFLAELEDDRRLREALTDTGSPLYELAEQAKRDIDAGLEEDLDLGRF